MLVPDRILRLPRAFVLVLLLPLGLLGCSAPMPDLTPSPRSGPRPARLRPRRLVGTADGLLGLPARDPWTCPSTNSLTPIPSRAQVPDLWKAARRAARGATARAPITSRSSCRRTPRPWPSTISRHPQLSRIEVQGKAVVQVGSASTDPATARAAYKPGFAASSRSRQRSRSWSACPITSIASAASGIRSSWAPPSRSRRGTSPSSRSPSRSPWLSASWALSCFCCTACDARRGPSSSRPPGPAPAPSASSSRDNTSSRASSRAFPSIS